MKGGLADSINSQIRTYTGSSTGAEAVRSEVSWLKLDIGKLNLDWKSVIPSHGLCWFDSFLGGKTETQ